MKQYGHLENYKLTLNVRTPLFIGSGEGLVKKEYLYFFNKKRISLLNEDAFFEMLINKNLIDDYEHSVLNGTFNDLYTYLHRDLKVPDNELMAICRCSYDIRHLLANNPKMNLRDIQIFMHHGNNRKYIPGSSVKGALRTVLLHSIIRERPDEPLDILRMAKTDFEGPYFNKLQYAGGNEKLQENPVSSIMRGIRISDSAEIPDQSFMLYDRSDMFPDGRITRLPILRECLKQRSSVEFCLTLDRSVLPNEWTPDFILHALENYAEFYKHTYLKHFAKYNTRGGEFDGPVMVLGGSSGYFGKNITYKYYGEERGLQEAVSTMCRSFPKHGHSEDVKYKISPHTLKCAEIMNQVVQMGLCEVEIS